MSRLNQKNNKNKNFGFTLIETLISFALGLFLISGLIKIYLWQSQIQHKISDMVFLDHNGVIAMTMLSNDIGRSQQIKILQNSNIKTLAVIADDKKTILYFVKNHKFYRKKDFDNAVEIVAGIDQFNVIILQNHQVKIVLHLTAPYGMSETLAKNMVYIL